MELSKAYTEVCAILELLGSEYIDKIPTQLYKYIISKKDNKIRVYYDIDKPINEQEVSKETLIFIVYLNLQYWCSDEKEKEELLKIYKQNDDKIERELREKYNPDNLFNKKQYSPKNESVQLIEYKKQSFIKSLIQKLIKTICFWKK